jgi:hypothetical protein
MQLQNPSGETSRLGLNGGFHVGEMVSSRMKNNHLDQLLGADITIKRRKVASTT